jgi:hypothetical protein
MCLSSNISLHCTSPKISYQPAYCCLSRYSLVRHGNRLSVTSGYGAVKQIKLRRFRFKAVHRSVGFKKRISIQDCNIANGFVVLCVKRFMCSDLVCVLNGTSCVFVFVPGTVPR